MNLKAPREGLRAALYARVSTRDQHEEMQLHEMLESCERRRWVTTLFPEPGVSGAREKRPVLDRMMREVRARRFDVVMVYKFDRFARSLHHLLKALEEFDELGVQFVSVRDQVDTTLASGRLMFQIIGAFAEFEREILRERISSAMDLRKSQLDSQGFFIAKKSGKRRESLGRPSCDVDTAYILARREQDEPWDAIAAELGVSVSTCQRAVLRASKGVFSRVM